MAASNKTVVYLDQIKGLYGTKANPDLLEDIASRYIAVRLKMFRLEKSWRKFMDKAKEDRDGEHIRALSKALCGQLIIIHTGNRLEPQRESFPAVAITVSNNSEPFDPADRMLNGNAYGRKSMIEFLFIL